MPKFGSPPSGSASRPSWSRRPATFVSQQARIGRLLVLPALIVFSVVILYPFVRAIIGAFFRDTLFLPEPVFGGLRNFRDLFASAPILASWTRTIVFVGVGTALTLLLGFAWAVVLNERWPGAKLMRSLSLLPWLFPSTVVAFLWAWIFNAQYGVINGLLLRLDLIDQPIYWLSSSAGAMSAVIVAKTWATIPFAMAFFLAALQTIPGDQLDAARVDGAGNGSVMRHIVLPHVRYTTVILVVLVAVNNLQHFDIIYAMTEGGPVRATTVLAIEVYKQAFQSWNIGLASAIGVVWLATIAVPAYYYLRSIFGDE